MNFPSIGGAYPYKCHSEQYQDKVECLGAQIQAWKGAFREGVLNAVNEQSKKLFDKQLKSYPSKVLNQHQ